MEDEASNDCLIYGECACGDHNCNRDFVSLAAAASLPTSVALFSFQRVGRVLFFPLPQP